ncbi:MAG: DHA2 family efflux MFS transporter permease subunit [Coriobacteriales bacterium]
MKNSGGAIALFTIMVLGAATGNLAQTALNTMLTTIVVDFGIDVSVGQWATTIYMLSLGIVVPTTSFITKKMQFRNYLFLSLSIFLVGGIVDAIAPTFLVLLVGRVLQAASAGLMTPVMQTIAITRFPPERQGTVMGIAGIAMGFAPNIGPTIGSLFMQGLGWRAFFIFLAAIPLVLLICTFFLLKKEEFEPMPVKFDATSFIFSAIAFGGLLAGLSQVSNVGFENIAVWVAIAIGVIFLVIFIKRQNRVDNPLINLSIFKSKHYKLGFWMQNLLFGSFMGVTLVIPLYTENVLGQGPVVAGMVLLPGAIAALIFNPLGGWLGDKIGKERVMVIGATLYFTGALLSLLFAETTPVWLVALLHVVRGAGVSTTMSCSIVWMLGELPKRNVNDGSSFTLLVRQACSSFGTAIMIFIVTATSSFLPGVGPYRMAFLFSAALGLALFVLTIVSVRPKRGSVEGESPVSLESGSAKK